MTYTAPVKDYRFVLDDIVGFDILRETGAFPDLSLDLTAAVLEGAGKLADDVVAPLNAPGDRAGLVRRGDGTVIMPDGFKNAYRQWVEGGWGCIPFDPAYGGQGLPKTLMLAVIEMMQGANVSFGLAPILTQGTVEALLVHGTQDQKDLYLPKLISGEWAGTMNLTEGQAGSDVGALRTRAVPRGDGSYAVTGTKIFISYGEHDLTENIIHMVLARLPDAPPGTPGISLFLVPKYLVNSDGSLGARNDVVCAGIEHKLGIHASPTCTMAYGEKGGATGTLIGAPNRGMAAMFTMMNNARLNVGIQGVGVAEGAFQKAFAYARERRQGHAFGRREGEPITIIGHPDVRRMLWTMKAQTEAIRAICFANAHAADLAVAHPNPAARAEAKAREDLLTPISKAYSTDLGIEIANLGIQVHGGMGYVEETGAAQYLRDGRVFAIYEGTNGIQANDLVTRKLPMEGGRILDHFTAEMAKTARDLQLSSDRGLERIGANLKDGIAAVTSASRYLLDALRANPDDALAGAVPFLRLMGTVAGGYFLARGALSAKSRLDHKDPDRAYLQNRIAIAQFFAETILPSAGGLAAASMRGAEGLYAVDPNAV